MKILQISPQISFPCDSGGRLGIYGITKSLSERGHDITFVCYAQNSVNENVKNELKKICKPVFIEWDTNNKISTAISNLFSKIPYNIYKYYSKKLECFLIEFLKHQEVDIVHVDHLHMAWVIDVIRKVSSVPVFLREHNLEMKIMQRYSQEQNNLILKLYARLQYKKFFFYEPNQCQKFNYCVMISSEDEKSLLSLNNKIKTKTIPVGVDKKIFELKKTEIEEHSLFHLGNLDWQPNLDGLTWFLSKIFPIVLRKYPDSRLYVYSGGMDKLIVPKELQKNVIKVGYIQDIWREISNKQLLIVPLRIGSGMRVKIVEMLAAGQPIVSTSIGKEGIDVKNGEHILIADSEEEFIHKILQFFQGEFDSRSISQKGKEFVKQHYNWNIIAKEFENLYLSLRK